MRWFLALTAAVAAFLVMVLAVGLFLPRRSRVAASGLVPADPDRVWDRLADPDGYPIWRPGVMAVESAEKSGDDGAVRRWKEMSMPGSATMEVVESEPGSLWTVRTVEHDLPFTIRRRYELVADEGATRVTVTEDRDVGHPGYRFLFRFLVGPEKRILEDLRGLRDHFAEEA